MKKIIVSILMLCLLCTTLSSCAVAPGKISSVKVDDLTTYQTLYLYSFKDAPVDNLIGATGGALTTTGYVYSNSKLEPGDTIEVWQQFKFGESSYKYSYGTTAIVDKKIDEFGVRVSAKNGTYVITYYTLEDSFSLRESTVREKHELKDTVKNKIQVSQDRVIIVFEAK
jgi:hypothetical protein